MTIGTKHASLFVHSGFIKIIIKKFTICQSADNSDSFIFIRERIMTKAAVTQYFDLLVKDDIFAQKIIDTGEDREAKLQVIKDHGLDFTKEEFIETCKEQAELIYKEDGELTDEGLEMVSGGGFFGAILGGAIGTAIGTAGGAVAGGVVGTVGGGILGVAGGAVLGTGEFGIIGAVFGSCIDSLNSKTKGSSASKNSLPLFLTVGGGLAVAGAGVGAIAGCVGGSAGGAMTGTAMGSGLGGAAGGVIGGGIGLLLPF